MTGEEAVRKGERDSESYRSGMAKKAAGKRNFILLQAAGLLAGAALAIFGPFWWLGPIAYVLCAAASAWFLQTERNPPGRLLRFWSATE